MRGSVPGELQGLTTRIDQQRASMQQIDQDLRQLQASLDQQVEGRVTELKNAIAIEAEHIQKYGAEKSELQASTDQILGPVATRTLNRVGSQFREFVLQADVGIIDVAWARKQAETTKVNDLIKEQQDRTSELEAEFSDVLTEE
jgi:chromosome segregation ATPase